MTCPASTPVWVTHQTRDSSSLGLLQPNSRIVHPTPSLYLLQEQVQGTLLLAVPVEHCGNVVAPTSSQQEGHVASQRNQWPLHRRQKVGRLRRGQWLRSPPCPQPQECPFNVTRELQGPVCWLLSKFLNYYCYCFYIEAVSNTELKFLNKPLANVEIKLHFRR